MQFGPLYSRTDVTPHHRSKLRFRLTSLLLVALAAMVTGESRSHAQTNDPRSPSQGIPKNMGGIGAQTTRRTGATIHVTILDENKKPLKQQSLIRLTNQTTGSVLFQTTHASETKFSELPAAKYLIEVGAAGYLGTHHEIAVPDVDHDVNETVMLSRDPVAVDLSWKDPGIPSWARKEVEKGVQALQLSSLPEARKHLEAANHRYPSSSWINFLLGYLALQQKDQDRELSYLTTATKLDPRNLQAQNLLGQLLYQRSDYAGAAAAEEIVVAGSGESLTARKVLANSCLKLKEFEKARENSQWLVDNGGSEGASARLVLGQALAGLHQNEAAIQTLKAYLDGDPASSVAPQIRKLIAQLEKQPSQGGGDADANIAVADPELTADSKSSAGSVATPSDVDAQRPSVAAGVQCPANILEATANPSKQLVDSVAQFSAIEHVVHENLSPRGIPKSRETRQYNYVASISEGPQGLMVQEYRDSEKLDSLANIKTTGLAVLAIAFHPLFHADFEMHCEGLGDWNGQAAWLVHFRQLEKPNSLRAYVVNGNTYSVHLKGRAWIGADNLQIIHLETDLLRPIPEIQLLTEHTSVSYGPVRFNRTGTDLWLPKSSELYVRFAKRSFHRSESFDHFMLFATEADYKAKLPKGAPIESPTADQGAALPQ
jgi:hypothetical protein